MNYPIRIHRLFRNKFPNRVDNTWASNDLENGKHRKKIFQISQSQCKPAIAISSSKVNSMLKNNLQLNSNKGLGLARISLLLTLKKAPSANPTLLPEQKQLTPRQKSRILCQKRKICKI